MATNLEEVQLALKAATEDAEATESSTDANDDELEASQEDKPKGKGKGAQARIQELVAKEKAAAEALETKSAEMQARFDTQQETIDRLTKLATSREGDSRVVAKINELYEKDPELKPIIEQLDAALKGNKVVVAAGDKADDKTVDKALDAINKTRAELEASQRELADQIADTRSDALVVQADNVIESLLNQLPGDKYDDKDLQVISTLLENQVNWEAVEKNPSSLAKEIETSFQEVVNWYGDPRGALKAQATKTTDETPVTSVKKTLDDILGKDKNWGKLKDTGRKDRTGRQVVEPAVSDSDFAKVLGTVLRHQDS